MNNSSLTNHTMEANNPEPKNFWQTLPGIITGTAGVITAITGLVIALNNLGVFQKSTANNQSENVVATENLEVNETQNPISDNAIETVNKSPNLLHAQFAMTSIKVDDELEYKILESSVEPSTPQKNILKINIRCINGSKYPMNFWAATFRLSIDDLPTSPFNELNELVDGNSAKDWNVDFEFPNDAKNLTFLIYSGDKKIEIPIYLIEN